MIKKIAILFFPFLFFCSLFLILTKAKAGVKPSMPIPVANFYSSDTAFCNESGKCIKFFDISTGNPTSWKWFFPGATPDTSTQQNPDTICYYTPGTYPVTLIVSNASGSDTLTVSPMINFANLPPPPIVGICGDTLYCTNGSLILHNLSYQWYLNGSPIAGATNYFYIATWVGTYNVQIIDNLHCTAISFGDTLLGSYCPGFASTNELTSLTDVTIYPNPASQALVISGLTPQAPFQARGEAGAAIEIYNVLGEKASPPAPLQRRAERTIVDISNLPDGVYFLKINLGEGTVNKKFVVVH